MFRLLNAVVIALSLFFVAPLAEARQPAAFVHETSDVAPDPGVVYGTLANGMRYALMRNTQPAGTAAIRLRIGAGSMQESEDVQGIAHYLEHMNFNGSKNVPEGEMVKLLQRKGLAFGPDTNAYTSFAETVYMLTLPTVDEDMIDTGLMIMRETGDRLPLDQGAIDRERGVILAEERGRDSPEYRALKARLGFLLAGQPLTTRWPIGTTATIQSVNREQFVRFYQANYRPERALLVMVGDFDVAKVEAKIKAKFSDWTQPGAPSAPLDFGRPARRGLSVAHFVEPGLPSSVIVSWVSPPETRPDSRAVRREDVIDGLAAAIINRRFQRIARQKDAPFIAASVGRSETERSAISTDLFASVRPGQWAQGLGAIEQEMRRAVRFGVSQAEIDRERAEFLASYEAAVQRAPTRTTSALADGIAGAFHDEEVFEHPQTDLEIAREALARATPSGVNAAIRRMARGQGPLVFVNAPEPIAGGDEAIRAAYRASAATKVTPPVAEQQAVFAYADFGAPGAIVSRTRDAEFDLDLVRFANGVALTVKKTPFQQGAISVNVRAPGGLQSVPLEKTGLIFLADYSMGQAGLGKMSVEDIERVTAGKVVGLSFDVGENSIGVSGQTRPEDFELQMQLLAAAVSDPGFRNDGLFRIQAAAENFLKQYVTAPDRIIGRDSGAILRSGDGRWAFPDLAQVRALSMDDYRAVFAPMLMGQPLELSIVGDVDVERAIALTAKTFAALPARSATALAKRNIRFPERGGAIELRHEGRADQAGAFIAWPGPDFADARKARAARLVGDILENRLVEIYREELGATYSPGAMSEASQNFAGYGYLAATVETKPADIAQFYATVAKIVAELREGRFTDDDVLRARTPVVDSLKNGEKANPYWISVLQDFQSNPRRAALMRTRVSDVEQLTRADLIAAAKEVFVDSRAIKITALPKAQ
jgi:zinc protease